MCRRDKCFPAVGGGWADPGGRAKQGRMLNWLCCKSVSLSALYRDLRSSNMTFLCLLSKSGRQLNQSYYYLEALTLLCFRGKSITVLEKAGH